MTFFKHPRALVESDAIGRGTRIWAFVHVMEGAEIGEQCNICDQAFVEDGVVIGDRVTVKNNVFICKGVRLEDDVFVGPAAVFTNDRFPRSARMPEIAAEHRTEDDWLEPTVVQRGASIGANATILCGITIGPHAMIGSGAVVVRDVPAFALVAGNPAREIGYVCLCGKKLTFKDNEAQCRCSRTYELKGKSNACRLTSPPLDLP